MKKTHLFPRNVNFPLAISVLHSLWPFLVTVCLYLYMHWTRVIPGREPLVESSVRSRTVAVFRLSSRKHHSCTNHNREPFLHSRTLQHFLFTSMTPSPHLFLSRLCRNICCSLRAARRVCYPLHIHVFTWVCESVCVCVCVWLAPVIFCPFHRFPCSRTQTFSHRCDYVCKSMCARFSVFALSSSPSAITGRLRPILTFCLFPSHGYCRLEADLPPSASFQCLCRIWQGCLDMCVCACGQNFSACLACSPDRVWPVLRLVPWWETSAIRDLTRLQGHNSRWDWKGLRPGCQRRKGGGVTNSWNRLRVSSQTSHLHPWRDLSRSVMLSFSHISPFVPVCLQLARSSDSGLLLSCPFSVPLLCPLPSALWCHVVLK